MNAVAAGTHAAIATISYVLTLLVLLVPIILLAAFVWWMWTGPAARAGMRLRAWRFVRSLRRS
jgi:hypothetical protein